MYSKIEWEFVGSIYLAKNRYKCLKNIGLMIEVQNNTWCSKVQEEKSVSWEKRQGSREGKLTNMKENEILKFKTFKFKKKGVKIVWRYLNEWVIFYLETISY